MSLQFTGERVVVGQVDEDLWNEHYSRYVFTTQFCKHAKVLDAGCGVGYGSNVLSDEAKTVIGIDVSEEVIRDAAGSYPAGNRLWLAASCTHLPFANASFDVVVAFEVIEHLHDWPKLILEAQRLLKPTGVFVVSTPNKVIYQETRGDAGPNPFHEHEFEYTEFREALTAFFPHVAIVHESHGGCVVFHSEIPSDAAVARFEGVAEPSKTHFYIAVCSQQPQQIPSLVYVPKSSNLKHGVGRLARIEEELAQKNAWLSEALRTHADLVRLHDEQTKELHSRNSWAHDLDIKLKAAGQRIVDLQVELQDQQRAALDTAEHYQKELEERTRWAQETEARLTSQLQERTDELRRQVEELGRSVALLDQAEATVIERTEWALRVQKELEEVQHKMALIRESRWFKLGRMIRLGPGLSS